MKRFKRIIVLCCLTFIAIAASCQTLEQARSLFSKGKYDKAKPVFQRYVKAHPTSANYNYWYGVCCLQTGEADEAIKYLQFAQKRRVTAASLYLGMAYDKTYRFEEAVDSYKTYLELSKNKSIDTQNIERLQHNSETNARMLKAVQDVCFIDSFIVDKKDFLSTYKLSGESGKLMAYNDYFGTKGRHDGVVYETQLANKIYYGDKDGGDTLHIFTKSKLSDGWGNATPLPESINSEGANVNYPFMLTDGMTIYFAADHGKGYDIYVTRYSSATDSYLMPENIGMPFNSPYANDYMYVIDEYSQLGWFATDRNQPEDSVCVYVFVPNTSRQSYNYEAMDPEQMRRLAQLTSIRDTWHDDKVVTEAQERLKRLMHKVTTVKKAYDFTFIIDDNHTYHSLNDFRSPAAQELFRSYQQTKSDYDKLLKDLSQGRNEYATADDAQKARLTKPILTMESQTEQMSRKLDTLKMEIRNEEIKVLTKGK